MKVKSRKSKAATALTIALLLCVFLLSLDLIHVPYVRASTFGNTGYSASAMSVNAGDVIVSNFTLTENGGLVSISVYVRSYSQMYMQAVLYNSTGSAPGDWVATTEQSQVASGTAWRTFTFASQVNCVADEYYIGLQPENYVECFYNNSLEGMAVAYETWDTEPDPFGTPDATHTRLLCAYATYMAAGESSAPDPLTVGVSGTGAGSVQTFYCRWNSTNGLSTGYFWTNSSAGFLNRTITFSDVPQWHNVSIVLNYTVGTVVAYEFRACDLSSTWNSTGIQTLTTTNTAQYYSIPFENTEEYQLGMYNDDKYVIYTDDFNTQYDGTPYFFNRGGYGFDLNGGTGIMYFEPDSGTVRNGVYSAKVGSSDTSVDSRRRVELLHDWDSPTTEYIWEIGYFYVPSHVDAFCAIQRIIYERLWNSTAPKVYQEFQLSLSLYNDSRTATKGEQILVLSLGKGDFDNNDDGTYDSYDYKHADLYSNGGTSSASFESDHPEGLALFDYQVPVGEWVGIKSLTYRNVSDYDNGSVAVWVHNGTDWYLLWNVTGVRTIGITPNRIASMQHSESVDNNDVAYFSSGFGCYTDMYSNAKHVFLDDVLISSQNQEPTATTYTLTVASATGGSTVPTVGEHTYYEDYNVSLVATASSGYVFAAWSVDDTNETTTSSTWYVVMDEDHAVQAYFTEIYPTPTPTPYFPVTISLPNLISNLIAYLEAGDLLGFLVACYTSVIGQLFYVILILCFTVPLALRTQSITYVSIVWLICGAVMIPAVPLISPASVLLLILGVGGLIYRVYTNE